MSGCHVRKALIGSIIHSKGFGQIEIIKLGALVYDGDGQILDIIDGDEAHLRKELKCFDEVFDHRGKLIIPGFIDAHCHAPQYRFSGTGMDLPLLSWLEKYTFPCESKFADLSFASTVYEKSIKRHLKCGTTFASYFATLHLEASKLLVDVINSVGQRAFVGKVRNMIDLFFFFFF